MSDYTDKNFTSSDWGLIQDCIVDAIDYTKSVRKNYADNETYEQEIQRLEEMLGRVATKYKQTRVS